jgi:AraC-like DNA-binding protein
LRHSRLPLKQIATLCGFKDEYYFSAVFRQLTQSSPGDFRRRA